MTAWEMTQASTVRKFTLEASQLIFVRKDAREDAGNGFPHGLTRNKCDTEHKSALG